MENETGLDLPFIAVTAIADGNEKELHFGCDSYLPSGVRCLAPIMNETHLATVRTQKTMRPSELEFDASKLRNVEQCFLRVGSKQCADYEAAIVNALAECEKLRVQTSSLPKAEPYARISGLDRFAASAEPSEGTPEILLYRHSSRDYFLIPLSSHRQIALPYFFRGFAFLPGFAAWAKKEVALFAKAEMVAVKGPDIREFANPNITIPVVVIDSEEAKR